MAMDRLNFTVQIAASPARVWETMLADATYRQWTTPFCEGSYYEGSWAEGAQIRFLSPEGGGMQAEIAANRLHSFISIHHLGVIPGHAGADSAEAGGAPDDWKDAYENYHFRAVDGGTELRIDTDANDAFRDYLQAAWPRALAALKAICESDRA